MKEKWKFFFFQNTQSLMSGKKNNGPRAEPCATPNITLYSNVDIESFFSCCIIILQALLFLEGQYKKTLQSKNGQNGGIVQF